MEAEGGQVTILLAKLTKGNQEAASRLIPLVYSEMRQPAPLARIVIFDYCCTVCVTDAEVSAMFESPL